MQLQYALYERTQAGYGWTWHAAGLSDALLDDFRYRIAVPDDSNSIRPEQLRGGICEFDRIIDGAVQEHVVLYRFFDGGTDAGRPNRVVMLTAWTTPAQVTGWPSRYEVAGVLRNRVFEYVSHNARAVGIAPPPFCESLTGHEEFPTGATRRVPAATLMEFIDAGLIDPDNDYYVAIRDDEYSLQRKPSASFERKKKERQAYEEQRLTAERARVEQEAARREAAAKERERQVATKAGNLGDARSGHSTGRGFGMKIGMPAIALMLCAVIGLLGASQITGWFGWREKKLSPEAEAVLLKFKGLEPDEQQAVLTQLKDWCEQPPAQRQLVPVGPRGRADSRQPALVSPKKTERGENLPNAGNPALGNPSVDQGVAPQPLN